MKNKIDKIFRYIHGISLEFALYGYIYKFYNTTDNYSRLKFGKEKFLERKMKRLIKKYKNHNSHKELYINKEKSHLEKFPIWVCWFQGENNAPEIVKICLNSIRTNISEDSEIHMITLENVKEYIEIPDYIEKKFLNKIISPAMYSDFIRVALLARYGGFWIDSTVLVTENISHLCNYDYYTKKSDMCELHFGNYLLQGRFAIHLLKINNNEVLINFLYDTLKLYFKKFNVPVDYYMTNMLVDIAYNNLIVVKEMMDNLEFNDRGLEGRLCEKLNNEFNDNEFNILCCNMPFQKLSHKLPEYKEEVNDKITFYGYIKKKYLK